MKTGFKGSFFLGVTLSTFLLVATGCQSVYYSAWEKFGVEKRDLLKKKVVAVRDEQKEAGEQFKDALTRFRELYGSPGGNLEKTYDALKGEYDDSAAKAAVVSKRITEVESIAGDLFTEWEKEIGEISSGELKSQSRTSLRETKERYDSLHRSLKRAEQSMDPVLTRFRDNVLYLKHNLNAQAIGSLKGEAASIQSDIQRLIDDMNRSIAQADEFIKAMK